MSPEASSVAAGVTTLVVLGAGDAGGCARWREALLAALASGASVRLDLTMSGPWDLAGLQLLLATLESARRAGQAVRMVRVPQVLSAIAEQAGVAKVLEPVMREE